MEGERERERERDINTQPLAQQSLPAVGYLYKSPSFMVRSSNAHRKVLHKIEPQVDPFNYTVDLGYAHVESVCGGACD